MGRKKKSVGNGETASPKKECQRGPGIAALERIRFEKQMRSIQHAVEPTIESVQSHLDLLNARQMGFGSMTTNDYSQVPSRWNKYVAPPAVIRPTAVRQPPRLDTELSLRPSIYTSNHSVENNTRNEDGMGSSSATENEELDLELKL